MIHVRGTCPMGCGQTLFVGSGGYVTCSYISCPKPDAASCLLEYSQFLDSELVEGAVNFCNQKVKS